jgi:hypothetical protein
MKFPQALALLVQRVRNRRRFGIVCLKPVTMEVAVNNIIYLVGLVVVVAFIASYVL